MGEKFLLGKMLISTLLLIANLAALVINGTPFMSFWWIPLAYIIEIGFYFFIFFCLCVLGVMLK